MAGRADRALAKFHRAPNSPGLNFEAVKGAPGFFTIRVNRNFRIMLRAQTDEAGPYYLIVDLDNHDDTYF
jgi:hypothetical protein